MPGKSKYSGIMFYFGCAAASKALSNWCPAAYNGVNSFFRKSTSLASCVKMLVGVKT